MKISGITGMAFVAMTLLLAGCKSTESTYKQAYEKAVGHDAVVETPVSENVSDVKAPKTEDIDMSTVSVREEKVTVVTGDGLKAYGIVCGSFSLKANADALCTRLKDSNYPAIVVLNEAGKTYRVVLNSFDTKEEAAKERALFKARYQDNKDFQAAWILYSK